MSESIRRIRYLFSGVVQGVGFRPHVYRAATKHRLGGYVCNTPEGVTLEVEGPAGRLAKFHAELTKSFPPASDVEGMSRSDVAVLGETEFRIVASEQEGRKKVLISPDIATCSDCLRELRDPADRRYRYPFINCTNCGPRLTIIRDVPYDRQNTSMACFPLCPRCRAEYENPADRRFHAEPNACPVCGPRLWMADGEGNELAADPVEKAAELLRAGKILAIKGLGGFHLAVDASNEEAVRRLRSRKYREEKPLAIMVRDIDAVSRIAKIGRAERELLLSPQRPIVLCRKLDDGPIAPSVAPGVPNQGIMLPYAPLHHLLMETGFTALVMTSANQVDEPICIANREALSRLKGIAEFFLLHNRDILVRCDDSVAAVMGQAPVLMRRSRGWAPKPVTLKRSYPDVLALGPHLKATLCILKGGLAYLSPHIGDLETPEARDFHRESLRVMERIAECRPDVIACDLHPAYWTTRLAGELPHREIIRVQHHHAHIVSAMAENGLSKEMIGLAMDGTGYGPDGTAWGGEFLVCDEADYRRAGHIRPYPLPGAEKAVKEPWRVAASLLRESFGGDWRGVAAKLPLGKKEGQFAVLENMMAQGFNSPLTSSLGRVFDGVAAILGTRQAVSFEGQAAMELETIAAGRSTRRYPFDIANDGGKLVLDLRPLVRAVVEERIRGKDPAAVAAAFHRTIIEAIAAVAAAVRVQAGLDKAVLSGGCFQNRVLLEGTVQALGKDGFTVYTHRLLPTNDGCIALGQAIVAASQLQLR
ncbi:MAG TPA: carbamoyltransferase HypF [Syntrophales bacterium]|nr:carbamoyltransferase HypF [Syntrophobacterales bacterium]HQL89926.1 carbamoyltransferase HypF [Syntrophales bacterium]